MKDELADKCDYSREASFLKRYGAPECLGDDARFQGVTGEHGACACDGTCGRRQHWGCCYRSAVSGRTERGAQVTLLVSMMLRGHMMLTYAVDCISNHRALLTGALPVQAHANRLKFYKLPV
jgi:hypothetical protein